jgi:hypothetical protein
MEHATDTTTADALASVIQRVCYSDAPRLAREADTNAGKRRARIHAETAMKVLEPNEPVEIVAVHVFNLTPFVSWLGDSVFLLTDRAIVSTWEPILPVALLSMKKRYEFTDIEDVSVEQSKRQLGTEYTRLVLRLRDHGSEVFSLSPSGAAEEAAQQIRGHISAVRGT